MERIKKSVADLEQLLQKSDRQSTRRPQNLNIMPQTSDNNESREMSRSALRLNSQNSVGGAKLEGHELSDKLKILEFKLNDHE